MTPRGLYLGARRITAAVALATAACASGALPELGAPDPHLESRYVARTTPSRPLLVRFDWSLAERDARFSGRAVARVQDDRARIDLFGPRGEAYLAAVVVAGELRLPPGVSQAPVPPPSLLWAALGIFRPPAGARLTGSENEGGRAQLGYTGVAEQWRFRFAGERMTGAERVAEGGARQLVELEGDDVAGMPRVAIYRDFAAFRELRLSTTDAEDVVEGFPPEIWDPVGP